MLSVAVAVIPLFLHSDLVRELPCHLTASMFAADCILLCVPVSLNGRKAALVCSTGILLLNCALPLCGAGEELAMCVSAFVLMSGVVFSVVSGAGRTGNIAAENVIWRYVEEQLRLALSMALLFTGMASVIFVRSKGTVPPLVSMSVLSVAYPVLYYRAYTGYSVLIGPERERRIREMSRSITKSSIPVESENELARMRTIFDRCQNLMNEKKPYLEPDFKLEKLSVMVYCNKGYISRCVNYFSGMNFRQFVNRKRIDYALELIETDPHLKVSEISEMCGFSTPVSFTMAFKLNVGARPSDYMKEKALAKLISR